MPELEKSVIFFPLFEINYAFVKSVRTSKSQSCQGNRNIPMGRINRPKFAPSLSLDTGLIPISLSV